MRIYPILFLCLVIFNACSHSTKEDSSNGVKTIVVDDLKEEKAPLSDYFKIKKVVILETTEKSLLGEIEKIFVSGDKIFIADDDAKSISVFSIEGKFLNRIQHVGKGPGEYVDITDFQVDNISQELTLFDIETEKLITYSADGKFLRERSYQYPASEFVMFDASMAIYCTNSSDANNMCEYGECSNFLIEQNNEIVYRACPVDKSQMGCYCTMFGFRAMQYSHNNVYLTEPLGHVIYAVSSDRIEPKYIIDYGAKTIPSDLSNVKVDFNYIYQYNHSISSIYEDEQMLFFQFERGMFTRAIVWDKRKDTFCYVNAYTDTENCIGLNLLSIKGNHNYLVNLVDPARFLRTTQNKNKPKFRNCKNSFMLN